MKKFAAVLGLTLLASTAVMAQDAPATDDGAPNNIYGELGITGLRGSNTALFSGKFKPTMLRGVLGTSFTPWLNGELMLGIGINSDQIPQPQPAPTVVNADVKTLVGVYATPTLHLNDNKAKLYARLGMTNITYSDVKIPVPPPSTIGMTGIFSKSNSFSWGLGGGFNITDRLSLNADYMVYYKHQGEKLDGFTLGLGYKF